jgi:hypothetical protein
VQSRRLIIDANILIRAVLGVRVRELIERYCESVAFYVAESNAEEAMQYLAELAPRRGIGDMAGCTDVNHDGFPDCSAGGTCLVVLGRMNRYG